jgi:RimJ/RimL family protein N-acetyltransferase
MADADCFIALEGELRALEDPPRAAPDPETWTAYLAQFVEVWDGGELGYWSAHHQDQLVGFGGVKPKRWRERDCWNLYYRLFPKETGRGFATELARAAVTAGAEVQPDWPVLVETRPTNIAAIAVAERAGLVRRPALDGDGWAVLLLER